MQDLLCGVGISVGHERCDEQSGDDGTEDQRVSGIREHRNSRISEDRHRDSSSRRRTNEDASHELAQVGNIPGHQDRSDDRKASQRAVMARSGDAMDVDAFTKGPKGSSKGCGKKKESRRKVIEAAGHRRWKVERFQKGDSKGKNNKKEFKGRCYKRGKIGHMSKDCRSKETSAFEAGDELAETRCIEMASIDLNALEIGAVQLLEENHGVRIGIDSCTAVTVFPKSVADDYPMLHTPSKGKSYRPASGKLVPDLSARKVQVKLKGWSLKCVNWRIADTDGGARNARHGTRCLLGSGFTTPPPHLLPRPLHAVPHVRSLTASATTQRSARPVGF